MGPAGWVSVWRIKDALERQAGGRGCRAGLSARSPSQEATHVVGWTPTAANVDQRADQSPHHTSQEAIAKNADSEQSVIFVEGGRIDSAMRIVVAAAGRRERREVMNPAESREGLAHGYEVQGVWNVRCVSCLPRRNDGTAEDAVFVGLAECRLARVEVSGHPLGGQETYIVRETMVATVDESSHREGTVESKMGNLAVGVNARVGPAGAMNPDRVAEQRAERGLDHLLDAQRIRLMLPTSVPSTLVGDRQLDNHRRPRRRTKKGSQTAR